MFSERRVVDNRVFLLGLDKLYRDALKQHERGELLRCARRLAAALHTTPAQVPVEGYYAEDAQLTKYTEALRLGNSPQAIALLEEAVELDSTFAMANRRLANLRGNAGADPERVRRAASSAYAHRVRVTERERYLTVGSYHNYVTGDEEGLIQAYQAVLRIDPDDFVALDNLAGQYLTLERYDEAVTLLERALAGPGGGTDIAHSTLTRARLSLGDTTAARAVLDRMTQRYPNAWLSDRVGWMVALCADDEGAAHSAARALAQNPNASLQLSAMGTSGGAFIDAAHDKPREAVAHFRDAARLGLAKRDPAEALRWLLAEADLLVRVAHDDAGARKLLREALPGRFDALPPARRQWAVAARQLADAGMVDQARTFYARWETETSPTSRPPNYAESRQATLAAIQAAAGELEAALRMYEELQAQRHCRGCYRFDVAELHARLGHAAEAIALFEKVVEEPYARPGGSGTFLEHFPWQRVLALEQLGPLHEAAGDPVKAVLAYSRFAEMWKDADAELQPRARAALGAAERLAAERGRR